MRATIKRWTMICIGWFFILLGIAGLFLPVLQGILFLLIGLLILSSEYLWAHNVLQRVRRRFPSASEHAARTLQRLRQRLDAFFHRSLDRRSHKTDSDVARYAGDRGKERGQEHDMNHAGRRGDKSCSA